MTDAAEFALDPTLLEKHAIIRQSRSGWPGIVTALTRLDTLEKNRDPYNEMEIDRDDVLEYAQTVRRCGDTIAYAVALALHLSRHSRASTPQLRVARGFEAMCDGLGLRQRDEDDTRRALKRCVRGLVPSLPFDSWTPDGQLDDAWTEQLQKLIEAVNSASPPADIQPPAWDAWQGRLAAAIQGVNDDSVDLNYLRCRAADALAGTILPVNVLALTINDLSSAYIKGVEKSDATARVPLWFAYGMLALLGFDTGNDLPTTLTSGGDREKEQTAQFLQRVTQTSTPRKGIIVARSKVESLTSSWMPLRTLPTLSVLFDEYVASARVDLRSYFASRLHGILLEVEPTDPVAEVQKRAAHLGASLPNIRVALLARAPRPDIQGFPIVVNPKDPAAASQAFTPSP
jgi:hypothetical protein